MGKIARRTLDIAMTVLTLVMMGGNGLFYNAFGETLDSGLVHEILGVILFILWAVHVAWNSAWIKGVLKGKYNALRIVRTVINAGVIVCVLFLMISGVMLSNHVFSWLGIENGASFARTAHLLASHWYFVFIALHIGLHVNVIFSRLGVAQFVMKSRATLIVSRLAVALIGAYGVYAFVERGLWKYLTLQQPFFFMDLERGYVLFFVDYIAMIVAFAVAIIFISSLTRLRQRG